MAEKTMRDEDWVPAPYVSGASRPRGEGSIFDPQARQAPGEGPRAFITGWPVWHSRSPMIHNGWLKAYGLPGSYGRLGVPPEEIAGFLRSLTPEAYVGGNVTVPHKVEAFEAAAKKDGDAAAIGAVNTLWFEKGVLCGGNTDAYGFSANLDERLAGWRDATRAVMIGAGGAARAVLHALLGAGIREIAIVNRSPARAEELAALFAGRPGARITVHGEEAREAALRGADLVVNSVPVPQDDGLAAALPDLSALADDALVTDIVYVPLETPILRAARLRGLRRADGLGMLLHQAVPGFERWFGRRPAADEALRARILADIEAA